MKKVDAEEDEVQDLGAPVVKGDEKKSSMLLNQSRKTVLAKVKGDEKPKTPCW